MRIPATIALATCLFAFTSPAFADRPDAWITAKVKLELLADEHVKGTRVNVDTTNRRVTLHGAVESEDQKTRAAELARSVEGVRDVRNLLVVAPDAARPADQQSDRVVKQRVEDALAHDSVLKDDDVDVKSVHRGVVVLAGRVDSLYEHQRAIRDAYGVAGVTKVASEIESPNDKGDLAIWQSAKPREGGKDPDAWDPLITTRVKLALMAAKDVPGLGINVDSTDGVVTLFGSVPDEATKQRAESLASGVGGVVRVKNELQVVPDREREESDARDRMLTNRVEERLESEPMLDDVDVDVEVHDGVARLTGKVTGDPQRLAAVVAARTTDGIRQVVDDLTVSRER